VPHLPHSTTGRSGAHSGHGGAIVGDQQIRALGDQITHRHTLHKVDVRANRLDRNSLVMTVRRHLAAARGGGGAITRNRWSIVRLFAKLVVGVASLHPHDSSETHAEVPSMLTSKNNGSGFSAMATFP
jgi:hypothetical protein